MRPQEIIEKKRDGKSLTRDEIAAFIAGVTKETWADYQVSAMIMAMFTRGIDADEQTFLTQEMLHSGKVLDFSDIEKPKADKHSTGGVGDKTSLIIAPLVAACGVAVPMISGRGLGHTGGTLDKLESIRGYRVNLSLKDFKSVIRKCGFAMNGQTSEIAPADKKIYALRDATATVPYIPLIVASIMSKKLAEGLDALVLDVKTGNGAFMESETDSLKLAAALTATGNSCGVKTQAVISDMSQPLGKFVGNALEVFEVLKILRSEDDDSMRPTRELSVELSARMLTLCGIAKTESLAVQMCEEKISDGSALECFRANVELQFGDTKICDSPERLLEKGLTEFPIRAARDGFIANINARAIGEAVCEIGGGRSMVDDTVDHAVGYRCENVLGAKVSKNDLLGLIICRASTPTLFAPEKIRNAYTITDEKPKVSKLIYKVIS